MSLFHLRSQDTDRENAFLLDEESLEIPHYLCSQPVPMKLTTAVLLLLPENFEKGNQKM